MTQVQGIDAGNTVAINGFDKLQDGSKITVRQPSQSAPQAGGKPGAQASEAPGSSAAGKKGGGSTQ
jgi:hypothetical protein